MEELERRLDAGWVVSGTVSQQELRVAQRAEDIAAATSKRSKRYLAIADADDQKEMDDEDHLRGANSVRSDHVFLHQVKRKEERKLATDKNNIRRLRRQAQRQRQNNDITSIIKRESSVVEASTLDGATTSDDDDSAVPAVASVPSTYMGEGSGLNLSEETEATSLISVSPTLTEKLKQHQKDGTSYVSMPPVCAHCKFIQLIMRIFHFLPPFPQA